MRSAKVRYVERRGYLTLVLEGAGLGRTYFRRSLIFSDSTEAYNFQVWDLGIDQIPFPNKTNPKPRTEDLREWGDLIRSCVVKKKDEFGQVGTSWELGTSQWIRSITKYQVLPIGNQLVPCICTSTKWVPGTEQSIEIFVFWLCTLGALIFLIDSTHNLRWSPLMSFGGIGRQWLGIQGEQIQLGSRTIGVF